MKKTSILVLLLVGTMLFGESLFQVKNTDGKTVLDVTSDGIVVISPNQGTNPSDTLMVISNSKMEFTVGSATQKGTLARSMSVVSTASSGKSTPTKVMEITAQDAKMRQGLTGDSYTNFSPENIFIGLKAGSNTNSATGQSNVFLGNNAGVNNTVGHNNIFIGDKAGNANVGNPTAGSSVGHENIYIGTQAGQKIADGQHNTLIGSFSGYNATSTAERNTFLGAFTGFNASGTSNTCIGLDAGRFLSTGNQNTYIGTSSAMNGQLSPLPNAGQGSRNTYLGYMTGYNNVVGNDNVFLGYYAGHQETGSNKLYISNKNTATPLIYGDFATEALTFNGSVSVNETAGNAKMYLKGTTGNSVIEFQKSGVYNGSFGCNLDNDYLFWYHGDNLSFKSGKLGIGNTAPGQKLDITAGNGRVQSGYSWLTNSDKRYKSNITTLTNSLENVRKMRGVRYDLKEDNNQTPNHGKHIGYIAQELEEVYPEFVVTDNNGYKSVSYDKMTAVLTEAVKELDQKNKQLEEKNNKLEKEISEIKEMLKKMNK